MPIKPKTLDQWATEEKAYETFNNETKRRQKDNRRNGEEDGG